METLYELLDVRPDDNAQALKRAFRRAVKATHPDANPADPGAPARFRRVLQAYAVLSDPEQRAAYEQLLALEVAAQRSQRYSVRKFCFDAVTVTCLATVMAGGYTLLARGAHPSADRELAIEAVAAVEATMRASTGRTAGPVPALAGAIDRNKPGNRHSSMEDPSPAKRAGTAVSAATHSDVLGLAENWSAFIVPVSRPAEDAKDGDAKDGDATKDGGAEDGDAKDGNVLPLPRADGAIAGSAISGERRGASLRDMKTRERRGIAQKRRATRPAPASEVALENRGATCSGCAAGTPVFFGVGY